MEVLSPHGIARCLPVRTTPFDFKSLRSRYVLICQEQLSRPVYEVSSDSITAALEKIAAIERKEEQEGHVSIEAAIPIELSPAAYTLLNSCFKGVSDEHRVQQLVQMLI